MGILLERNGANPNAPDEHGRISLWWAARNGCKRITELLRDRPGSIPRYIAKIQLFEFFSELSELSEPFQKDPQVLTPNDKIRIFSLRLPDIPSGNGRNLTKRGPKLFKDSSLRSGLASHRRL